MKNLEEINEHIEEAIESVKKEDRSINPKGYDMACFKALAETAKEVFDYVAERINASNFHACGASNMLFSKINCIGPFEVLEYDKLLYPENFNTIHFPTIDSMMEFNKEYLADMAKRLLEKYPNAKPRDIEHWKKLIKLNETSNDEINEKPEQ